MPCRCIGWVIMVSLTNLKLTRSPYFSRIGSASPYFTSFSDQMIALHVAGDSDLDLSVGARSL